MVNLRPKSIPRRTASILVAGPLFLAITLLGQSNSLPKVGGLPGHTVTLGGTGFEPSELTINLGDTVRFTTTRSKPFWPASNLHPTHEIYPQFDPKHPIAANDTFSFKFDQAGSWRYHDHLYPGFTGVINVVGGNVKGTSLDCKSPKLHDDEKDQCYRYAIIDALEKNGVKAAFEKLRELYDKDPKIFADRGGCHLYAHDIGDHAYGLYLKNKDLSHIEINDESVWCGHGYYHGFLEHLFREHPNIDEGRSLCRYIISKLPSIPSLRENCYHGLGHGLIPEPPASSAWGNPQAMIEPALAGCDILSPTHDELETLECLEGAFNVLADWIANKRYGISQPEDSLWLCPTQSSYFHKYACYYELSMRIRSIKETGLAKIAELYVNKIEDDRIAAMIMDNIAASTITASLLENDYNPYILDCQKIQDRLRQQCLVGLVGGIMAEAVPDEEHLKAIKICNSPVLEPKYLGLCFEHLVERLRRFYPEARVEEVCAGFPEVAHKYCPKS
jgi:plastocyanin